MSGHSKFNNIKHTKEKMDKQRGKIFTKLGKEIAVAVKMGGSDPNSNAKLANIISKARSNNMPNDNIQRSIKKAAGELGGGNYEEITYEGYGIGGSAVIVNVLTDNKNRAAGDVRHIFDKCGGSMGSTGCVSFMFERLGELVIEKNDTITEDELFEWAIESEANDVVDDGDVFEVYTDPSKFNQVKDALEAKGIKFLSADITLIPSSYIDLDEKQTQSFEKMIDMLEDNDDVQDVYHNVNLND
ncbi:MAG: YebC/PmpR family DNA-binding transcriptional regulator [Clostridiales bacterium]|nr:YebC/PmpR family DNA-binding transcriptional regulator [Clostridiales bacterium]